MADPHRSLTVGSLFGPYRLDRLIGRGGMGEVYQAFDIAHERVVALKVLAAALAGDPVYRSLFQRECRLTARLREAHVIPIHDFGEIDGRLFLDMRLVDGGSVRALLKRHGAMSPEAAVELIGQVAAALDAAHAGGLLHRDVKPDNILVTPDGFAYLVDFGIARADDDETRTGTGVPIGSLGYMAPERFGAAKATAAVDVYALACVLYECLTGVRAYTGNSAAQLISAHLFDPVPRPSEVRPDLPVAFDEIVARGMAKVAADRYPSAGGLAAAARVALAAGPDAGSAGADTEITPPVAVRAGDPQVGFRRRGAVFAVLILMAVVSVFVGWVALQGDKRGVATPDATALHPADIELLSRAASNGYKRANCHHAPSSGAIASFLCAANPVTGDPAAQFLRYSSLDNLNDAYMTFRRNYRATACTGDPAGPDGPSAFHDAEAGRKACFVDHGDPAAPKPALVLTNTGLLAMAVYTWDAPNGEALRDYVAQHDDLAQFQNSAGAQDPDSFTAADLALLTEVGAGYLRANCRHEHPQDPNTMADTRIACSLADGFSLAFVSYPDRQTAIMRYQARLAQVSGRRCGGSGIDDVWNRAGSPVGRLFCYDDVTGSGPQHPCLQAVHDAPAFAVVVCTLQPDDPHEGPKTEAELGAWFQQRFG